MLRNYFLCTIKVLLKRKLYTFISLLAISLTLAILLVLLTIIDNFLHPSGPEKYSKQLLTINSLRIWDEKGVANRSGGIGYKFYQDNITRLKVPEKISLYSQLQTMSSYLPKDPNSTKLTEKITSNFRYTDLTYWQILDFEFVAGHGFKQQTFDQALMEIIINQSTAKAIFAQQNPINQNLKIGRQSYRIIGVVKDVSYLELEAKSDIWAPYVTQPSTSYQHQIIDNWNVMLYHSNSKMHEAMKQEYHQLINKDIILTAHNDIDTDQLYTVADSYTNDRLDKLVRFINQSAEPNSGAKHFFIYGALIMLGFMLIPAINLINLNISRIMERAGEIGVRKSFGASTSQLLQQFFIENLILTTIGAVIGVILSLLILYLIESSPFIPYITLNLGINSLFYTLILVVVFSFMSGSIPAWKVSKLHPITALKRDV